MRVLDFVVDRQRLTRDRDCDFANIVAGSVGYLRAKFHFSMDWYGCKKAASFWKKDQEFAVLLDQNDECLIPKEVLDDSSFKVSVTGVRQGYQITSTKIKVKQEVY
jgi:hypothetical protein